MNSENKMKKIKFITICISIKKLTIFILSLCNIEIIYRFPLHQKHEYINFLFELRVVFQYLISVHNNKIIFYSRILKSLTLQEY